MMKVITGEMISTSFGKMLVYKEQQELLSVGDKVLANDEPYIIRRIYPPSRPSAKWAAELEEVKEYYNTSE